MLKKLCTITQLRTGFNPASKSLAKHADRTEFHRSRKLVALSGIVGCGKTTILRRIQAALSQDKEILKSKSLSFETSQISLATLIMRYSTIWLRRRILRSPLSPKDGNESDVFLLAKAKAKALKVGPTPSPVVPPQPAPGGAAVPIGSEPAPVPPFGPSQPPVAEVKTLHVFGTLPRRCWNRLGTRLPNRVAPGRKGL